MMRPFSSRVTSSQMPMTNGTLCSTTSTVIPASFNLSRSWPSWARSSSLSSGSRLVKKQQVRHGHDGPGHFDGALETERQLFHGIANGFRRKANHSERCQRTAAAAGGATRNSRRVEDRAQDRCVLTPDEPQLDILECREFADELRHLEGAADAGAGNAMSAPLRDIATSQDNCTRIRREVTGQRVKERRLTGPVGTNEPAKSAAFKIEIDIVERQYAAKAFDDATCLDHLDLPANGGAKPSVKRRGRLRRKCQSSGRRRRRAAASEDTLKGTKQASTKPSGNARTPSSKAKPSTTALYWLNGPTQKLNATSGSMPTSGPHAVPAPPSTTPVNKRSVRLRLKVSAFTKRCA